MSAAPAPAPRRALSLLFAVAFAFAPVVAAVHASEHAHRFCAEHNAFEEASLSHADTSPTSRAGQALSALAELDDANHLPCPFANAGTRVAVARSERALLEVPPASFGEVPKTVARAHPPIPELLFAPKVSPPPNA